LDLDEQHWDEQIERDITAGKLDFLTQEAFAEFEGVTAGYSTVGRR
jgi:hypothetical protein